jgi:hypothetical protein
MMIINAGWQRVVLSGKKKVTELKNTVGVCVDLPSEVWDGCDHSQIRAELMKNKPAGDDWTLQGYCLIDRQ